MDPIGNPRTETQDQVDRGPRTQGLTSINRRDWLRLTVGGGAGLALGELLDVSTVRAATQRLKLENVNEFTTSCNFCSCGCGMIAAVRDGKLLTMEGDYDHIVNRGSLCVKGISMFATHTSPMGGYLVGKRGGTNRAKDSKDPRRDVDRHRETRRRGGSGQPDGCDRLHGRRTKHQRGVLPLPKSGAPARHRFRRAPGPTLTQPDGPRSGGCVRAGGDDQPLD